MFSVKPQAQNTRHQCSMLRVRSFLASIRFEIIYYHTQWGAGIAVRAMGPVGKEATASKAFGNQFGIGGIVDEVTGSCHLRTGLPLW